MAPLCGGDMITSNGQIVKTPLLIRVTLKRYLACAAVTYQHGTTDAANR